MESDPVSGGAYCGIRMLLNSSGTAFMISTSFGALARQYLLDAYSDRLQQSRSSVPHACLD